MKSLPNKIKAILSNKNLISKEEEAEIRAVEKQKIVFKVRKKRSHVREVNFDQFQELLNAATSLSISNSSVWKETTNAIRNLEGTLSLKELKLRPGTEIHDYNFKLKNAKKFLSKGDKVKFTVRFKGREMQHVQLGKDLMNRIIEDTKDIGKVETHPKFEGRQMIMIIQPL